MAERRTKEERTPKAGKESTWNQEDVLAEKDHVTSTTSRGLQIWGDEMGAPGVGGQQGKASQGTAERSAEITTAQRAAQAKADADAQADAEPDED